MKVALQQHTRISITHTAAATAHISKPHSSRQSGPKDQYSYIIKQKTLYRLDPAREHGNHVRLEFRPRLARCVHVVGGLAPVLFRFVLSGRREGQGANEQRPVYNAR